MVSQGKWGKKSSGSHNNGLISSSSSLLSSLSISSRRASLFSLFLSSFLLFFPSSLFFIPHVANALPDHRPSQSPSSFAFLNSGQPHTCPGHRFTANSTTTMNLLNKDDALSLARVCPASCFVFFVGIAVKGCADSPSSTVWPERPRGEEKARMCMSGQGAQAGAQDALSFLEKHVDRAITMFSLIPLSTNQQQQQQPCPALPIAP